MADEDGAGELAGIRDLLADARVRIEEAGVADQPLAELVPARRTLGIARRARLVPVTTVWPLGVFLLDRELTLYEAGETTRAVPPGHPQHVALSQERRRELRAAAMRGPFEPGETIHLSARRVALEPDALRAADGPLTLDGGALLVRWSAAVPGTRGIPFRRYLDERVDLLVHPPEGA